MDMPEKYSGFCLDEVRVEEAFIDFEEAIKSRDFDSFVSIGSVLQWQSSSEERFINIFVQLLINKDYELIEYFKKKSNSIIDVTIFNCLLRKRFNEILPKIKTYSRTGEKEFEELKDLLESRIYWIGEAYFKHILTC